MNLTDAFKLLNTYLQQHGDQRRFTLDMDPMKGVDLAVEFIAISSAFRHAEDYENSQLIFIAQSILDDYFSQKWAEENDPEEIAKKTPQQVSPTKVQDSLESQNSLHFTYNNTRDLSTPTDANQPLLSDNHPTTKPTKPR